MIAPRSVVSEPPLYQRRAAPPATSDTLRRIAWVLSTTMWIGFPPSIPRYSGALKRLCHTTRLGTNGGTLNVFIDTPTAPSVLPENRNHLTLNQLSILIKISCAGA